MKEGGEQRAHARRELELPVLVDDTGNRVRGQLRFDVRDLSLGGAFLRSSVLFEVGEELQLEFEIPDGPTICARGRVVRVARGPSAREAGMGIAFAGLSRSDEDALRSLLARNRNPTR